MVAEVVGGLLTGSLALLVDAGHMLSDVLSLALALVAVRLDFRVLRERTTRARLARVAYGSRRVQPPGSAQRTCSANSISSTPFASAGRRS